MDCPDNIRILTHICHHMKALHPATLLIAGIILIAACKGGRNKIAPSDLEATARDMKLYVHSDSADTAFSRMILGLLKEKAYRDLAEHIHPDEGILFAPYGYIDTTLNRKFSRASFLAMLNDGGTLRINWGKYDGSGLPMELTWDEYASRFIYNADFLQAPQFTINGLKSSGNSVNNIDSIFTGHHYTESFFPGFEEKYAGLDWTSLRLVFKAKEGKLYLVGIVHDQWTS
jgi:hypothetical protein